MTLVFTFRSLKKFVLLPFFLVYSCFIFAQNAIVTENLLPGNPQSEWDVSGAGDLTIQGFATDISVNKGSTIHFKINTDASAYTIDIYRLGYYQGNGARKVGVGTITAALPQSQPADLYDASTGLTDCGNWAESAHWDVPSTAVSGIYIAKLTRTDNSGSSHIVFIVRDDASTSDLFFKTSDATWEAYNVYGGNSLYVGSTSYASGHAAKVSYNRPFITRDGGGGGGAAEDWLFNAEYPMIRWLEKNGYNISYTTDVDVDRNGSFILNHKVFLSVGHDEYWSAQARSNVEAARNAGIHLAFFSGNEIYWKTRYENSTDGSSTPYRTLVCYKEGTLGENVCGGKCDPLPNTWTGLWRDGCSFPTNDGCNPENALSGQISWDGTTGAIEVPDTYKNLRFWRNTSVASLTAGQTKTFSDGTLGYEWDWDQYQTSFPTGRFTLSSTLLNTHKHQLSIYKAASGALVFGAGTVQWSWGLDGNHDRGGSVEDADMQQATVNLFADMGVQPGSLQTGLIPATASTDTQAPVSIITSPANGVLLPNGSTVTISGTASDNAVVAGVEVSTDGGAHWTAATGTTSWTFSWIPDVAGVVIIKSRAIDDSGILEAEGSAPSANVVIDTVSAPLPVVCPCTAFQPTDVPSTPLTNDGQAIELGVKFQVTENGYITGIRYYKGAGATGLHRGHIWSSTTLLAEAIFTSETASGWQQVNFPTPIPVVTGTTYLASYHSNSGDYAFTDYYYTTAKVNGPIRFLADGEDGANGVYRYSSEPSYPGDNYHSSNYWVDVVFNTTVAPDTIPPTITATSPAANATGVNINSPVSATFSEAIDVSTLNTSSFLLLDASSTSVPATVSYNAATRTAILSPISPLAYLTTYTVTVKGGTGYQRIKDVEGNALANDSSWTFTTSPVPPPPPPAPTEGPGGPILVISGATNPFSRYPVEILRAEGLNEFTAMDISLVNATILNNYEVIVLGEFPLTAADVTMFTNWVNAGGTLIALRPDAQLAPLLGITSAGSSMSDKYLLVNNTGAGIGIVNQTIQYHGAADLYNLSGASSLATLYSSASAATVYPAVTIHNVGTNGGQAVAFTYDLARSIVYTRQGNPLWAGQKRDGQIDPIRSDDQFFPDYVDLSKVAIPQADEQQHLLSNIIIKSNLHHKPLPKFWFLPKGVKAAVVMTGDNHGDAGMQPRFDINITESPAGCSVDDWDCIRSTGYLYVGSTFTDSMALYYSNLGFEVALHVNTNCNNFTRSEYENYVTSQLTDFSNTFPSISRPSTNRNHCIAWSDWSTTPEVEVEQGIRLDANYYYWPGSWVNNQPGMFTGSGMPMRFAKMDGTIIDCYQAVTQMPDESDESFPSFCDALLDKAQGPEGYYGVFTTNMHFDNTNHAGANAIVASALAHHIPVVSAKQMLTWLDGRNNSSFGSLSWNADTLKFNVTAATGSRNMQAMVPTNAATGHLTAIYVNSSLATYTVQTIKGIEYAFISAPAGNYAAIYGDTTLLHITALAATPVSTTSANITWNTDHAADSHVKYGLSPTVLNQSASAAALVNSHTILLSGLSPATTYYYRVTSTDAASDSATAPVLALPPQNFVTPGTPCAIDEVAADFNSGTPDANITVSDETDGEVILKALFSDDFTGTSLSSNWTSGTWTSGGTATLSTGSLNVDGSFAATNSTFAPGSSMEFVATFQSATFQNIGFATDAAFSAPWITIGQGSSAGTLYARSDAGTSVALGAGLVGTPHLYRINWNPSSFDFYVDGVLSATITQTITGNMVAIASDYNSGGGILQADWIHVTPYALAGSFTSRIFDHSDTTTWNTITWNGITPSGTTLNMFVRTGNTAIPDGTWAAFSSVANGASIGVASRYIQYRADLSTINSANTPVLQDISIGCGTAVICVPPTASISAVNPQVCLGGNISLQLDSASGQPPYTLTVNGTSYTNVLPGQTFAVIPPTEHSIWGSSGSPANANASDALPIETGTKFRASVNGYVTGIRFYKGVTNTGIHTASLWNTNGKQLATAPFTAETASGWQEVHFATPVYIKADTTYIASYFSPGGTFAITPSFFAGTGVSNPPLSALQAGTDGVNGVYKYGGGFPDGGNTANYWVDVLFMQEQTSAQIINYTLTNITDNLTCSNAGTSLSTTAVTVNPLPNGTIASAGPVCQGQPLDLVFNATAGTGPFQLVINDSTYTGITSGVPFNTGASTSTGLKSIWSSSTIPGTVSVTVDSSSIELGVKFRSTVAGKIKGIRFYKGSANTGTHTGSLWSATGTLLATATFTSETSSGWQQVLFSSAVDISANTTYIASYFAPVGRYAFDNSYFASGAVISPPLKALQNGEDGGNGVFTYSGGGVFPTNTFGASNYWVDVLFSASDSNNFSLHQIADAKGCGFVNSGNTINIQTYSSANSSRGLSICNGDSILLGGSYRKIAGTYYDSLNTVHGCDSIVTTTLNIKPTSHFTATSSVCSGSSYTFPDGSTQTNITSTITHASNFTNVFGCDSIISTTVTIHPVYNQTATATICSGTNFTFPDGSTQTNITSTTIHASNLHSVFGCDSIIITTVNISPGYYQTATAVVCSGSSFTFPDGVIHTNITSTIAYTSYLHTVFGCDSTILTTVYVNPGYHQNVALSVCTGSTYTYPDGFVQTNITSGTSHISNLISTRGCDSIITTTITVNPLLVVTANATSTSLCAGTSVTLTGSGANTYSWSGSVLDGVSFIPLATQVYTLIGSDVNNCKDTTTITINVHPLPVVTFDTLGFADSVCLNAGIQTFAGASPTGGIYSGTGISGVTFDPVAAGLGAHIITYTYSDSNSCSNTSTHDVIVVSCGTTSVQQNNNDNANLIIYPNPNSGTITVSFKNRLDVIHIYNTIGELVYQTRSDNVKETIDISALNSGVYTLEVQGNYVKIIKQ